MPTDPQGDTIDPRHFVRFRGFRSWGIGVPSRAVQPDYGQWQAVQIGMTRAEVVAFLGNPLPRSRRRGPSLPVEPYVTYGYLKLPMTPDTGRHLFCIGYGPDGRVVSKVDPFGGVFSNDGRPCEPQIVGPAEGSTFSHYPRLVDMRWHPCSGAYPLRYEVAVAFGNPVDERWSLDEVVVHDLPCPFFIHAFVGAQAGRFRVRGINAVGEGPWSAYRLFHFTV